MSKVTQDMTEGNIVSHMLRYTLPLMAGNFFHLLYNTVDSVIVGNVNGKQALAAIGAAGPVMNILLFLIVGISMGSSILMSHAFGSGDYQKLKRQMVTATLATMWFTIALSVFSYALCGNILHWTRTPEKIFLESRSYLRIIICGLIFSGLYNILAASLRAIGNATAPLWILVGSSLMNIALDLIFVGVFRMGIRGAAFATVISQGFSALSCMIYINRKVPYFQFCYQELKIDMALLKQTISFSSVSAFQQTILYVGRILVQAAVNTIGIDAVAAFNITTIIDNFVLEPNNSLASALMVFTAQNTGAGKRERVHTGFRTALLIGILLNCAIAGLVFFCAGFLLKLFLGVPDPGVIAEGTKYLHLMCLGYVIAAFCNVFQGLFRGMGQLRVTVAATLIQIPVRVIISYMLVGRLGIRAIPLGTMLGWIGMVIYAVYKYRTVWGRKKQPEQDC